jgi:hypothetical protein
LFSQSYGHNGNNTNQVRHRNPFLLSKMTLTKLIETFKSQASFTKSYSPLYKTLFSGMASCLERDPNCETMKWLVDVSAKRAPLEATLLLLAGMHREVLLDAPGTQMLRQYYPSVGGAKCHTDSDLPDIFEQALSSRKDSLSQLIQYATVQTNETGRGIFWLFPAVLTGWKRMHLVDLGASAGLNLVGDLRRYTLVGPCQTDIASFGLATHNQFVAKCEPEVPHYWDSLPDIPHIVTRSGCDLKPFPLETDLDRTTLKSFVWADQIQRITRLDEGIAAHASVHSKNPIRILPANLPHDLPKFLQSLPLDDDGTPVLVYNTYMTVYLEDEGLALREYIGAWAKETKRSVLWAQAEPPKEGMAEAPQGFHWCAWTVDLWRPGEEDPLSWHIAWVHPHGTEIKWLTPSLDSFVEELRRI